MSVAWITGGARGIGRATALRLAAGGHDIAIGYHTQRAEAEKVRDEVERLGRRAHLSQGDLSDPAIVTEAHRQIIDALGPVDILVASHGIYTRTPLQELDLATWQRTLDVNLTGAFLVTQAVLPSMRERGKGRIVYLGSILGRIGSTQGAHYAATKAGLMALCRSVAQDIARHGVTVNLVAPSMIDTDLLASDTAEKRKGREATVPLGRIGTPDEVAAAIAYLVSEEAGYVTGTELRVDGGFQMG